MNPEVNWIVIQEDLEYSINFFYPVHVYNGNNLLTKLKHCGQFEGKFSASLADTKCKLLYIFTCQSIGVYWVMRTRTFNAL